jgi:hypothetical protein
MDNIKKKKNKEDQDKELEDLKKKQFMDQLRPPFCWNFLDEHGDSSHHLRPFVNPVECYKFDSENRVSTLLEEIETIGWNLRTNEEVRWKKLVEHCIYIFIQTDKNKKDEGPSPVKK